MLGSEGAGISIATIPSNDRKKIWYVDKRCQHNFINQALSTKLYLPKNAAEIKSFISSSGVF